MWAAEVQGCGVGLPVAVGIGASLFSSCVCRQNKNNSKAFGTRLEWCSSPTAVLVIPKHDLGMQRDCYDSSIIWMVSTSSVAPHLKQPIVLSVLMQGNWQPGVKWECWGCAASWAWLHPWGWVMGSVLQAEVWSGCHTTHGLCVVQAVMWAVAEWCPSAPDAGNPGGTWLCWGDGATLSFAP